MHVKGNVGSTYCTRIIIHIPKTKRGVAANLACPHVGLTYVHVVVGKKHISTYYSTINIEVVFPDVPTLNVNSTFPHLPIPTYPNHCDCGSIFR
jgi:hypothetical protein